MCFLLQVCAFCFCYVLSVTKSTCFLFLCCLFFPLTQVRCQSLTIASISSNIFINWNSVKTVFDYAEHDVFECSYLSHISRTYRAAGGLEYQEICSFDEYSLIRCISMFNLLVVPFRLVPHSLYTSGKSLLTTNETIGVTTFNSFKGKKAEESSSMFKSCPSLLYRDWSK